MLEILEAGFLDTIQDTGRPGYGSLGVPVSGAADPWSLGVANLLAGNAPDAAAMELTLAGPRLRVLAEVTVALAGSDLGARVEPGGRPLAPGRSARLHAGEELLLAGPARGGARAYLAVAGGIDTPVVLGSRSTCLAGGFGGLDGRALRAGDVLVASAAAADALDGWPGDATAPRRRARDGATILRVLAAPGQTALGAAGTTWTVAPESDRMGIRLDGPAVEAGDEVTSHGVVVGTIQVPPGGAPIVLLADHQPTGGYAVAAVVIAADLPALGQLAPGEGVRFASVDLPTAQAALRSRRQAWSSAVQILRADAPWHDLWRSAGA